VQLAQDRQHSGAKPAGIGQTPKPPAADQLQALAFIHALQHRGPPSGWCGAPPPPGPGPAGPSDMPLWPNPPVHPDTSRRLPKGGAKGLPVKPTRVSSSIAFCSPNAVPSPAPPSASETVWQCSVLTAYGNDAKGGSMLSFRFLAAPHLPSPGYGQSEGNPPTRGCAEQPSARSFPGHRDSGKRGRQPSSRAVLASRQVPVLPSRPDRHPGIGMSREARAGPGIAASRALVPDRANPG
jgi:hypothetical protein